MCLNGRLIIDVRSGVDELVYTFRLLANCGHVITMTNIIDLRSHRELQRDRTSVGGRAAVVADLVALSSGVKEAVEKTLELRGLSFLHTEQTVQHLVDALHHLENAMGVLTEDGEWEPF